ncbi:MAG: halocyanin domain-containing protein [Halolamina sp.]
MTETTRRRALAALATAATVGAVATPGAAAEGLAEWFENTSNYDGVVDRTGRSEVTVTVGVEANGGAFGFGPAAVRVDPGTTVTWQWTGNGGSHNVVARDGSFESELAGEAGHAFSHTFDADGVVRYVCAPHETMGMKGAVVVGDAVGVDDTADASQETAETAETDAATTGASGDAESGSAGDDNGSTGNGAMLSMDAALLAGLLGAVTSPLWFGLYLASRGRGTDADEDGETAPVGHRRGN